MIEGGAYSAILDSFFVGFSVSVVQCCMSKD